MLGRYQVLKPLAKGGMAEVLLARAIGLAKFERYVVIKRIRVEHGSDQKAIDMFLDEARLVASLHHRNIVQVLDVGEESGKYFFVMEYVHGRDTRELLRHVKDGKQQLPLEHVLTIVTAAAAGLHYAHEQRGSDRKPLGIVHRDISPGNILVAFDGGVKVVDFGIAKAAARAVDTQAGETKGKLGYMAPEQCKAGALDRRTDVFLLGIVLWELCTVRRLYRADTRFETMALIVDGEVPPPTKFRKDMPAELEAIVMKALAKDPAERYQSADALRLALESFAASAGMSLSAGRLSDYLKQQFGEVPEPWLVDDPVPPPSPEEIARRTSQSYAIPQPAPDAAAEPAPEHAAGPAGSPASEPAGSPASEPAASLAPAASAARQPEAPPAQAPAPAPGPPPAVVAANTHSTQPELEAIRAAKPIVEGLPAPPEPFDGTARWPVDPSSVRRRRAILIGFGVVVVAAAAFAIIAFWGTDVPAPTASPLPPPSSTTPLVPPPTEPPPIPAVAAPQTGLSDVEPAVIVDAGVEPAASAAATVVDAGVVVDAGASTSTPIKRKPRPRPAHDQPPVAPPDASPLEPEPTAAPVGSDRSAEPPQP